MKTPRDLLRRPLLEIRRRPVIWASGSVLVAQSIMAVYGVMTSRLLGPDGKGIVTSVTTWSQLLAWGSVAGMGTAISVGVAGATAGEPTEEAVRHALANAFAIAIIVGGFLTVAASLILPSLLAHLGPQLRFLTLLSMVTIPVQMLAVMTLMIQLALGRTRLYAVAQIANPVTTTIVGATFWLATSHLTPLNVVWSTVAGGIVSVIVSSWRLPWRSMRVSAAGLRQDLAFGGKVHLGSLFRLTNLRLDYLIMSIFLPAVEVGLYSAANSAMLPISTVPVVAATLLSPAIAGLRVDDSVQSRTRQIRIIETKAKRYSVCAAAGGVLICLSSAKLIPFLLGHAFEGSVRLIWILTPGYVALCFNNIVAAGTAGMKRPWIGTVAEVVAVVMTLLFLPILLPTLGAEGAAITSSIAYIVSAATAGVGFARLKRSGGSNGR